MAPEFVQSLHIDRRRFFGLGAAAAGGLLAAGCGTSGVSNPTSAGAAASGTGGSSAAASGAASGTAGGSGGNLTIWANSVLTADKDKGLAAAKAAFEQANGVTIDLQGVPTTDLVAKLTTTVSGGGGPDIAIVDSSAVPQLAAGEVLADITTQLSTVKDQFVADAWTASSFNGKQYGVPYYTNDVVLYVNKALLSKAGIEVPTNWADLRSAAIELTGGGSYGYMMGASGYGSFLFWPWLWQNGGQIVGADGLTPAFGDAAGQEAFEFYANLAITDKVAPPEYVSVNSSWDAYVAPFVQGKVAMMATGPWGVPAITKGNPNLEWSVAPLPKGKQEATILGGATIGVSTKSANPDLAVRFVEWITSADQVSAIQDSGNIPGRTDIVDSSWASEDPVRAVFVKQIPQAKARPTLPTWGSVEWGVMADAWDSVIQGQAAPKDALAKAAQDSIAALKG